MKKLAISLHVYYKDQLDNILKYLENIGSVSFDLFVSMVNYDEKVISAIRDVVPQAQFFVVENRGYDIGPFIEFLHRVNIDNYEYILKLHTKGNKSKNYTNSTGYRMDNALWGRVMWDSMLRDKKILNKNLDFMDYHKNVGMLGSKYCLVKNKKAYEKLLPMINDILIKIGRPKVEELFFIAGSMFLVRAACFKPLLKYTIEDFEITDASVKEGTLAHAMERVFGVLGQSVEAVDHGGYLFDFLCTSFKRFLYQKKITSKGVKIIKICKIPIWRKEVE